jgi:predicted ATPase/class 3 adenylate cyclase
MTGRGETALPTGTVTFLFTDIEGSTRLVQSLGDQYAAVLAEHCRIMRQAIAEAGGTEIGTEGDSFFAVFPDAALGLEATVSAQRGLATAAWPAGADVRVRMGLHTGEGTLGGENYIGLDVHRAARVASAGHGGQVLLSGSTRAVAGDRLPTDVRLRDLGAHRLKDLANPEHLYQLEIEGLPADFPALRSLDTRANNLPVQLTSFVGREQEIVAVGALLDRAPLVTLAGPGGTGKTRLALQVAAERLARYSDGVFFVELAAIGDAALVPSAIAGALNLRETADRSVLETVKDYLRDREMLLVLDNFEQILPAGPTVVELLSAAPRMSVLVTSRSVLRLRGEQEYEVPPLRIPDPSRLPSTEALSAFDGVALFVDRAMAVRPGFAVTNETAPAVAEIVARLDGLPLAIELAAAKIRILAPEAILARLGSRLAFLGGGARDLPARQQTLRAAIDWSYALLSEPEQQALRALGVFVGGFTVDAAAAILPSGEGDPTDVLERLADQSLLRPLEGLKAEPRFTILETIREYALERLAEYGESEAARRRHAEHFLARAEGLEPRLTTSSDTVDAVEQDHDNYRAVLGWAIETGDAEIGLRLGHALWRFWQQRGHFREASAWFERLLAIPSASEQTPARAKGLTGAAGIAYWQNDYPAALAWYREAEAIIRDLGDQAWLADAVYNTGTTAAVSDDMETVAAKLAEGAAIGRALADDAILSRFLQAEGYMAFMGDDLERARDLLEEGLAIAKRGDDAFATAVANHTVGQVARLQGRLEDAARHYREALRIGGEQGDAAGILEPLQGAAAVAIATGDTVRGVRLLGASAAIRERLGGGPPPEWLRLGDPLSEARERLSPAEFESAWERGQAMPTADAIADAIAAPGT